MKSLGTELSAAHLPTQEPSGFLRDIPEGFLKYLKGFIHIYIYVYMDP